MATITPHFRQKMIYACQLSALNPDKKPILPLSQIAADICEYRHIRIHYIGETNQYDCAEIEAIALLFFCQVWFVCGFDERTNKFRHFRHENIQQMDPREHRLETDDDSSLLLERFCQVGS